MGSCVDCSLCVQVCPTGIDIRDGLQYECIGCGVCVDVCDTVMDKVGQARGLIKYATQSAIDYHWTQKQMFKRVLRPRVLVYAAVLGLLVVGLFTSLWVRTSFKVDIVRDRTVMARLVENGMLENIYQLQIMNATESMQRYRLSVSGLKGAKVGFENSKNNPFIAVKSAESRWVVVDVEIPDGSIATGKHKIEFVIQSIDNKETVREKSVFLIPR